MFAALKKYANSHQLFGLICNDKDDLSIIAVNSITEEFVEKYDFPITQATMVLTELPKIANCFKAFIVDIYGLDFQSTTYNICYLYCGELKQIFDDLKIPNYFISDENFHFSSLLIAAEVDVQVDEKVFLISPHEFPSKTSFGLIVGEYKFTSNGFQLISRKNLTSLSSKESPEALCQKICGTPNPKNVIAAMSRCKKIPLKKIFKPKNLTLIDCCLCCFRDKTIIEMCEWIFDKSCVKYFILPTSVRNIQIFGDYGGSKKNRLDILKVEKCEPLPITKTAIFLKSVPAVPIFYKDSHSREYCFQKPLSKDCHEWEITLTVDENNFEEVKLSQLIADKLDLLRILMNTRMESKIPFIAFFGNSSIIAVHKNSVVGYEYMEEWGGIYGTDCFISFEQKRPNFGEKAVECLKTKNTFVVFDLLKIMSMPSGDIKISNTWGFTFTKDSKNPVLLEFDNFDGTKKASSPSFLMALYLRQHLKAIETKIGEKPKQIGLFIRLEFNDEEMERIKDGFKESFRLLKLDVCFIDAKTLEFDFVNWGL